MDNLWIYFDFTKFVSLAYSLPESNRTPDHLQGRVTSICVEYLEFLLDSDNFHQALATIPSLGRDMSKE